MTSARPRPSVRLHAIGCALIALFATPAAAEDADAEQLFERATDKVGLGEIREAVGLLERVAGEFPASRSAAEALFLAGELYEDQLDDPTSAAASYRAIVVNHADSRVAVAAGRRLAALEAMLGDDPADAEKLARFFELRRRAAELGATSALAQADALLAGTSGWRSGDRVRVWMAGVALRDGQRARAEELYRAAMAAGDHDIAYQATMAASALARDRYDFDEARRLAEHLDPKGVPGRLEARREALLAIDRAERRERVRVVAMALLLAVPLILVGLLLWRARSLRLLASAAWPPPIETIYMAPIGLTFAVASFTGHHGIARAVIMVLVAGVAISWLSGAGLRVAPRSRWQPLLHAVLAVTAVAAACYVALHHNHLLDLIISTVRFGPDV